MVSHEESWEKGGEGTLLGGRKAGLRDDEVHQSIPKEKKVQSRRSHQQWKVPQPREKGDEKDINKRGGDRGAILPEKGGFAKGGRIVKPDDKGRHYAALQKGAKRHVNVKSLN